MLSQLFTGAAAATPNLRTIAILLRDGVPPNVRDRNGFTALLVAAEAGNAEVATLLVGSGADCNARTPARETALHIAARADSHLVCALVSDG